MESVQDMVHRIEDTPELEQTTLEKLIMMVYDLGYNDGQEDYELNRG